MSLFHLCVSYVNNNNNNNLQHQLATLLHFGGELNLPLILKRPSSLCVQLPPSTGVPRRAADATQGQFAHQRVCRAIIVVFYLRGWAYSVYKHPIPTLLSLRGWAYDTTWAYTTYNSPCVNAVHIDH